MNYVKVKKSRETAGQIFMNFSQDERGECLANDLKTNKQTKNCTHPKALPIVFEAASSKSVITIGFCIISYREHKCNVSLKMHILHRYVPGAPSLFPLLRSNGLS